MSLITMLILTAIVTPVRVCFIDDSDFDSWYPVDLFFDIYFIIDILINFLSAFYNSSN